MASRSYVAVIVQAPTRVFLFFLTNCGPVSKVPGLCCVQADRRRSGKGQRCSAASACLAPSLPEERLFQSPHPLGSPLLFQQTILISNVRMRLCFFFWVTGCGGEQLLVFVFRDTSRSLTSVRCILL